LLTFTAEPVVDDGACGGFLLKPVATIVSFRVGDPQPDDPRFLLPTASSITTAGNDAVLGAGEESRRRAITDVLGVGGGVLSTDDHLTLRLTTPSPPDSVFFFFLRNDERRDASSPATFSLTNLYQYDTTNVGLDKGRGCQTQFNMVKKMSRKRSVHELR
jgi:hypothetical protein